MEQFAAVDANNAPSLRVAPSLDRATTHTAQRMLILAIHATSLSGKSRSYSVLTTE